MKNLTFNRNTMKNLKLILTAFAFVFVSFTSFAQKVDSKPTLTTTPAAQKPSTPVKWNEVVYDFGELKKGVPVSHDFTFTNTTKSVVLITNVKASCGCTATDYTKTPVKPGETAYVKATYNAAASGSFSKTVTVTLNENESPVILTIKGKVVDPQS